MRLVIIVLTLVLVPLAAGAAEPLLLTNARIVDPATQRIVEGSLAIADGRIVAGPEAEILDFEGRVVDLEGKWVIPGLVDAHVHAYGNMGPGNVFDSPGTAVVAHRMLYAGVTAFLDLFGREDALVELREKQRAGEAGGADLFASLSCLTATKGHCTEYGVETRTMDSAEEAAAVVSDLATRKPDVVKIVYAPTGRMPSIDEATLRAAVATATARGIKTVIHVNTWDDARDAMEAGATAITHVPLGELPADLAKAMAEKRMFHIPTLTVHTDYRYFVLEPAVLGSPLAMALSSSEMRAAYHAEAESEHIESWKERSRAREAAVLGSVKTLADAGVTMLTGTDAGNYGTLQGFSIHRELQKLVQAGLTPWQALAAATTAPGEFLGRDFGVAQGDEANLVVLEASPIEDVGNTQKIAMVIHHGRVIDRGALLKAPEAASGN